MIRSAMPSLRFIFQSLLPGEPFDRFGGGGASTLPLSGSLLFTSEPPQRGFMLIDALIWQNVSRAPRCLTAFVYPENTGLVDFVAKYFSLSDQRQPTCDERPEMIFLN